MSKAMCVTIKPNTIDTYKGWSKKAQLAPSDKLFSVES